MVSYAQTLWVSDDQSVARCPFQETVGLCISLCERYCRGWTGEIYPARAYETAAKSLAAWPVKITSGKEGMKLSGIGKGCAAKV